MSEMLRLDVAWWEILFRAVVIYVAVLLGLRFLGPRGLGQRTAYDIVLILIVANAVQNAMIGPDTSLTGGLLAAAALFVTNRVFGDLLRYNDRARRMLEGAPEVLINRGQVLEGQLRKSRISMDELQEALDEHGIEHVSDVKLAILEMDGSLSIIPSSAASSHSRRDIRRRREDASG